MLSWQAHKSKITSIAFSRDGQLLATSTGGTRAVYFWSTATGKLVRWLHAQWPDGRLTGAVSCVCFAPDAPLVAAATTLGVNIWETNTWELLADLDIKYAHKATFSSGEMPLFAASNTGWTGIWANPATRHTIQKRRFDQRLQLNALAELHFSPDSRHLAISSEPRAQIWDFRTGQVVQTLRDDNKRYLTRGMVRYSPDGSRIALVYGKWVDVLAVGDTATPRLTFPAGRGRYPAIWALNWTPDGRVLMTAGFDGEVRYWDSHTGNELQALDWGIGQLRCADISPDGLTCAVGSDNGQVVVWDVEV